MESEDQLAALAAHVAGLTLAVRALLETHPNPEDALTALDRAFASATAARNLEARRNASA